MKEVLWRTIRRYWFLTVEVLFGVLGIVALAFDFSLPTWLWTILVAVPLMAGLLLTALDLKRERDLAQRDLENRTRRREVRTQLATLRREAPLGRVLSVIQTLDAGMPAGMDPGEPSRWAARVRRHLQETPELGAEYVASFDALIEPDRNYTTNPFDQLELNAFVLRERMRRLEQFREEFSDTP